jgi:hypothetical protein
MYMTGELNNLKYLNMKIKIFFFRKKKTEDGTITHSNYPWPPQQLSQKSLLGQALEHHRHSPLVLSLNQQHLHQELASGTAPQASSGFPNYLVLYFNNIKNI